jgi:hypothetical protein
VDSGADGHVGRDLEVESKASWPIKSRRWRVDELRLGLALDPWLRLFQNRHPKGPGSFGSRGECGSSALLSISSKETETGFLEPVAGFILKLQKISFGLEAMCSGSRVWFLNKTLKV